ncbi:MAG: MBL fold metallo-hydrolase [Chloroflexi bacterium]|nr:MBL fold metallo-hydrolase [Chloroflexota bacterium]
MRISNLTDSKSMIYSSNVYMLLGDWSAIGDVNTLIDVGNDPSVIERIRTLPTGVGKRAVDQVIITHGHFDHSEMLEDVRAQFDPIVYAFSPYLTPDVLLKDGMDLRCGDREFEVIYTPGHSDDSICLYCQTDGILFAGDTPVVIRSSDGSYEDRFVWALERITQKEVRTIYFGHGAPLTENANLVLAESLRNVQAAQRVRGRQSMPTSPVS